MSDETKCIYCERQIESGIVCANCRPLLENALAEGDAFLKDRKTKEEASHD